MKRKIFKSILAFSLLMVCTITTTGCTNSLGVEEKPMIEITGIYYGSITSDYEKSSWTSAEGMDDCIVTFYFNNDDTNRTMPELSGYANNDDITLSIGENSYNAFTTDSLDINCTLPRYTSYKQVAGYGNVLGGSDPIKMYAHFFVNPNDLQNDNEVTLTIGEDLVGNADVSISKQISHVIEILDQDSDEKLGADLLYRADTSFLNFQYLIKEKIGIPSGYGLYRDSGSEWSLIHDCMVNCFSSNLGVTLDVESNYGGDQDLRYDKDSFSSDLTGFDKEAAKTAFPEIADNIENVVNETNGMAEAAVAYGQPRSVFESYSNQMASDYAAICEYFSVSVYEN